MAFTLGTTKPGQLVPQMNVTPLVDVVLVLLIIFMVVTPLLTKQAWMNVPPAATSDVTDPPADAPPPIVVTVDATGRVKINGDEASRDTLGAKVQGMLNARADKVVFFDADAKAPYEKAVEVLDLLKSSGPTTVAVLADALPAN